MNETRGNSRTKQVKNPIFPDNFNEREPLKERENHSLKDSEKTTGYIDKVKTTTKTKEINIKLTLPEIQALAIAAAEEWIKYKKEYKHPLHIKTEFDNKKIKNWKNLSEKLFSIYRINEYKTRNNIYK